MRYENPSGPGAEDPKDETSQERSVFNWGVIRIFESSVEGITICEEQPCASFSSIALSASFLGSVVCLHFFKNR